MYVRPLAPAPAVPGAAPAPRRPRAPAPVDGPVEVLVAEPRLAEGLAGAQRAAAERRCVARASSLPRTPRGGWADDLGAVGSGHLLVLEGHCLLRTTIDHGERSADVVGPGDLLPSRTHDDVDVVSDLRVLTDTTVAVLDDAFQGGAARWPLVGRNLTELALRRNAELARTLALMHIAKMPVRVHHVLWRLAVRWGHVTRAGVRLPFPIDQSSLADLAGARRPSINIALRALREAGDLCDGPDGRLVVRDPRGDGAGG